MRALSLMCLAVAVLAPSASLADPVYQRICNSAPCSGPFARIEVLNNAAQQPARLRYRGDLRACSHPPAVYFDLDGKELARVDDWLRIDKESVDHATRVHAEMAGDLTVSTEVTCLRVCKVSDPTSGRMDCSGS